MPGIYDEDGKIRCTASPGSGFVGAYAPDGSWYVTPSPGSGFVGSRAPDGSLYITDATGSTDIGYYAPDGSVRITTGTDRNGALWISGWTGTVEEDYLLADDLTWVTLTRGSVATYWDENGVLQTVTGDTPRFDYDPATLNKRGLLREMAATNILWPSQAQPGGSPGWVPGASSVTLEANTSDTLSPDGTNNATKVIGTNQTIAGRFNNSTAFSNSAGLATLSAFVKLGGVETVVQMYFGLALSDSATDKYANFELSGSGSVVAGAGITDADIKPLQDDWYWIWIQSEVAATTSNGLVALAFTDGDINATRQKTIDLTTSHSFYFHSFEFRMGDHRWSPPIPTTTAAVTRNADVLTAALYTTDAVTEYYRSVSDLTQDSRVIDPFSDVNSETDSVWIEKFVKAAAPAIPDSILLESGDYLLLESGDYLLLE